MRRHRWITRKDVKDLGLVLLGILIVWIIAVSTDNPQDRPQMIDYEMDPRR